MRLRPALLALVGFVLALAGPAFAAGPDVDDLSFDQHPGGVVPVDTRLTIETGRPATLAELGGGRPVVLALGYFHCPSLCGVVRQDLVAALDRSGLASPADYALVAVSIDPSETPADAAAALAEDRARLTDPARAGGWSYAVTDAAALSALSDAVGFRSRYDERLRQFLHPAGLVVLTGDGRVSSYVLGVGYGPGDVRAAVTLAGQGGVARAALPLLLLCFHFDAATGRYTLAIMKVLRLAGGLTVLVILALLALLWHRGRQQFRQNP